MFNCIQLYFHTLKEVILYDALRAPDPKVKTMNYFIFFKCFPPGIQEPLIFLSLVFISLPFHTLDTERL